MAIYKERERGTEIQTCFYRGIPRGGSPKVKTIALGIILVSADFWFCLVQILNVPVETISMILETSEAKFCLGNLEWQQD